MLAASAPGVCSAVYLAVGQPAMQGGLLNCTQQTESICLYPEYMRAQYAIALRNAPTCRVVHVFHVRCS